MIGASTSNSEVNFDLDFIKSLYYPETGNAKSTSVAKCVYHHCSTYLSPYCSSSIQLEGCFIFFQGKNPPQEVRENQRDMSHAKHNPMLHLTLRRTNRQQKKYKF